MEPTANLKEVVDILSTADSAEGLQKRLEACGIEGDLKAIPAEQVPERFRELMGEFLARPLAQISIEQITALTCEVKALSGDGVDPAPKTDSGTDLSMSQDLDPVAAIYQLSIGQEGSVQFILPKGKSIVEALREINQQCSKREDRTHLAVHSSELEWFEGREEAKIDAREDLAHDIVGVVEGSVGISRDEQQSLVEGQESTVATPEQVALAAALVYLQTGKDFLSGVWVRTNAPGVAFTTVPGRGVHVTKPDDDVGGNPLVGCAASRNTKINPE